MPHVRSAARWTLRVAVAASLALVGFAVTILIILPRASHGVALTVLTGSMTPGIPVGSVVIDRPVDPGTLKVGDVATYQKTAGKSEYITHRIVAINAKTTPITFTFKGDANRGADPDPVPATAIRGKVWFHVPYLGAIRDSLQSHGSRGVALLAAIIGLAGFALYQIGSAIRRRDVREPLVMRFAADAFDGTDPAIVARLFGGESAIDDDGRMATLTFSTSAGHLAVIRDLLAPYQLADAAEASSAKAEGRHRVSAHVTP